MKNRLCNIAPTDAENPHASAALSKRAGRVESGFGAKGGTLASYEEKLFRF